ncbi:helix-turn-helix domain-containing protein [Nocardia salmonicida]|uniref:helix-turn-helix domain-containing protein n=1 Tax=Nocardia salmonicida TaxID=53431 RepID=UPI00340F4169
MNQTLKRPKVAPSEANHRVHSPPSLPVDIRNLLRVLGKVALKLSEDEVPNQHWLAGELSQLDIKQVTHDDLLTVAESCARLRLSKWSLYRLIHNNELKTVKVGSRRFVPVREVERFLEALVAKGGVL